MKISTIRISAVAVVAFIVSGCAPQSYFRAANDVVAVNAPDRMKGDWTYSIDDSIKDARRSNFKPGGHPCSLHTYSIDAGVALDSAIRKAMQEFLENGAEKKSASDAKRHIAFRLESYQPRFSCAIGQVEGHCTGTAEIALGITVVRGDDRKSFTVSSERTADAAGGNMCAGALDAPAEASRKAAKDVVERAMERVLTALK